jgi:hypothetical protein
MLHQENLSVIGIKARHHESTVRAFFVSQACWNSYEQEVTGNPALQ